VGLRHPAPFEKQGMRTLIRITLAATAIGLLINPSLQAAEPAGASIPLDSQQVETPAAPVQEEAVQRELKASEDPLDQQATEKQKLPRYRYQDHTSLNAYGSVRLSYIDTIKQADFDDSGSRIGINGELQFLPDIWLLGRAEAGFNILDSINGLINANGRPSEEERSASLRLLYGGVQTANSTISFGKNWSSYYQVASITDRFEAFGGEASGAFNAQTDGGATGTGRADNVLQGRLFIDTLPKSWQMKPFKLNVQWQASEDIPQLEDASYDGSIGISAILESKSKKIVGIAYNQAFVNNDDRPALKQRGAGGDARALLIGTRRFGDRYYIGATLSLLDNHETTDRGNYFDGWGWETFASYQLKNRWWVVGGWNLLEAMDDQRLAGEYRLRYAVIGFRYTFDQFQRMIYSEIRLDDSRNADGSRPGNIYAIGVRWDFY
jgi:predicted porin